MAESIKCYGVRTPDGTMWHDSKADADATAEQYEVRKRYLHCWMSQAQFDSLPELNG